jgi:N-dimethylarginine dimethylaminohydrolase
VIKEEPEQSSQTSSISMKTEENDLPDEHAYASKQIQIHKTASQHPAYVEALKAPETMVQV